MVHEIRSRAMLEGYGGHAPVDKEAIIDCLLRLSWLFEEVPLIRSVALSPVHVRPGHGGLRCGQARVALRGQEAGSPSRRATAAGNSLS